MRQGVEHSSDNQGSESRCDGKPLRAIDWLQWRKRSGGEWAHKGSRHFFESGITPSPGTRCTPGAL